MAPKAKSGPDFIPEAATLIVPIADADNRFSRSHKFVDDIAQMVGDLIRQDFSRGNIVAVAEAPGKRQDLEIMHNAGVFQQPIDMHKFRRCAGPFKGMGGFAVAVGAGGAEDENSGFHGNEFTLL